MRLLPFFAAISCAALLSAHGIVSFALAKPVARVDGVEISDEELKLAVDDLAPQLPNMDDAQKRQYVLDYLLDLKLVARSAEKEKLADNTDFARQLAFQREKLLMERYLAKAGEAGANEAAMKKLYDETLTKVKPEQEVRARHILVETEEQAKAALERLGKGEDFAKLATELSKDPGSGTEGGDLGYFTQDRMVKEFADQAFKMKAGEVSPAVKSQFGFHIIKVEDLRTRAIPPYDQVKDQLKRYLVQKSQQDVVLKLREAAKVERLDADGKAIEPKKP
jgi:peptidyl-prolyl cis-trans isomerase C